jgi:hypothetical protein
LLDGRPHVLTADAILIVAIRILSGRSSQSQQVTQDAARVFHNACNILAVHQVQSAAPF